MSGSVLTTSPSVRALSDDQLLSLQKTLASQRRAIDAEAAVVAAEIAFRSRGELGYSGLSVRLGARTPETLLQQVTGFSAADARTLVHVGALVSQPTTEMMAVSAAVVSGDLSLEAARAIHLGLGSPTTGITADQLARAAAGLVADSAGLTVQQLASRARAARDHLDERGILQRESDRRDRRYLTLTQLPDGMTRVSALLDPESAAIIVSAVNAITGPRRGGPRFVDGETAVDPTDERTVPQLMADALVDLVKMATLAPSGRKLIGARRVGVRVLVAERDLRRAVGPAHIEGQTASVSVETATRIACDSAILPIVFDGGQPLKLGRDQRLYTSHQRIAIAARDGGCLVVGCDRAPDMCEVHHINEWLRDAGCTDVEDGILLCRHHHMLVHNNGWRIERVATDYLMVSPTGQATAMPSKNPILARVQT